MKELIEKWCQFCEGKLNIDYSEFYTLFHEDLTDEDIRTILQYFPAKEELFKRVKYVKEDLKHPLSEEQIIKLISQDMSEKNRILSDIGRADLVERTKDLKVVPLEDRAELSKYMDSDLNIDYIELIGGFLREQRFSDNVQYIALSNAFYGLTNSFEIRWFLSSPLLKYPVDFSSSVELWKNKTLYAVDEDAIYFA